MRFAALAFLALLLLPIAAFADISDGASEANAFYNKTLLSGDAVSLHLLRDLANKGNPEAQLYIGFLYGADSRNALKWYKKSTDQNYPQADIQMGIMYKKGEGVPKDAVEADKWFQKALNIWQPLADKGEALAQSHISDMYYNGYGVKQDGLKTYEWLRKAADQGLASAQYAVGDTFYNGQYGEYKTKKNPAEGFKWMFKSAQQGNADAQYELYKKYKEGKDIKQDWAEAYFWFGLSQYAALDPRSYNIDEVAKHLTTEQRDALDKKIREWEPSPLPVYMDAWDALKHRDYAVSLKMLKSLADQGNAKAQFSLGSLYMQGEGVKQDETEGLKWWGKAAEGGLLEAQMRLGDHYTTFSPPRSYRESTDYKQYAEAFKWFYMAANQGEYTVQKIIGELCYRGMGVKQSYEEGYFWSSLGIKNDLDPDGTDWKSPQFIADEKKHLTAEKIASVDKRVQEWKPTPAPVVK